MALRASEQGRKRAANQLEVNADSAQTVGQRSPLAGAKEILGYTIGRNALTGGRSQVHTHAEDRDHKVGIGG